MRGELRACRVRLGVVRAGRVHGQSCRLDPALVRIGLHLGVFHGFLGQLVEVEKQYKSRSRAISRLDQNWKAL